MSQPSILSATSEAAKTFGIPKGTQGELVRTYQDGNLFVVKLLEDAQTPHKTMHPAGFTTTYRATCWQLS